MTLRLAAPLSLLALCFTGPGSSAAAAEASHGQPLRIVIDPGHGGRRCGAVGPGGTKEKDVALDIAWRVAERCQKELGARVALTRTADRDLDLAERAAVANRRHASLFLSIHANSLPPSRARLVTRGIQTYFLSANASGAAAAALAERENMDDARHASWGNGKDDVDAILDNLAFTAAQSNSSRLAYALQQHLVAATGGEDRGVQQAPFFVLTGTQIPAVLVEVGFISNPEEEKLLGSAAYQDKIAEAIVQGIAEFEQAVAPRTAGR